MCERYNVEAEVDLGLKATKNSRVKSIAINLLFSLLMIRIVATLTDFLKNFIAVFC